MAHDHDDDSMTNPPSNKMMTKLFPLVSCYCFLSQVKHFRKITENINKS